MPWLRVAALLVAPFVLGALVGLVLHSLLRPRRGLRWLLIGALWGAALTVAFLSPRVLATLSFWDILGVALRFGLGSTIALAWQGRPPWGRLTFALVFTLVLVEGATRLAMPPPNMTPPDPNRPLLVPTDVRFPECRVLAPDGGGQPFAHRNWLPPGEADDSAGLPVVVHLGDSLVAGLSTPGPAGETGFVDILDRAAPGVVHRNAGYPNTGTDFQYLVAERLLTAAERPDAIVLYLFQNDPENLDRPMACCSSEPFLVYEPVVRARCATPRWQGTWERGAEPYVLGMLSHVSQAAAVLRSTFLIVQNCRGGFRGGDPLECVAGNAPDTSAALAHITAILRRLQERCDELGVTLRVVVLPHCIELEAAADDGRAIPARARSLGTTHATLLGVVREAGIEPLNPWPILLEAVQDPPATLWVDATDLHFGLDGHYLVAEWLVGALGATGLDLGVSLP